MCEGGGGETGECVKGEGCEAGECVRGEGETGKYVRGGGEYVRGKGVYTSYLTCIFVLL